MSDLYTTAIPTFAPVSIKAIDIFSNEETDIDTLAALGNWIDIEAGHFLNWNQAVAFKTMFIQLFNELMLPDIELTRETDSVEMTYLDSTYIITAV